MFYIEVKIITNKTHNIVRIPSGEKEKLIKTLENYFGCPAILKPGMGDGVFLQMYNIGETKVYFSEDYLDR